MTDSMLRRSLAGTLAQLALFATLTAGTSTGATASAGAQSTPPPGGPLKQAGAGEPQARLIAMSVLPARTSRSGSPPSGAFLSADERATAAANGIEGAVDAAYFAAQPVQGISSLIPAENGAWWALADNGYAWRGNSADWQLVIYRIAPRWREKRRTRNSWRPSRCAIPTGAFRGRSSAIRRTATLFPASPSTGYPSRRRSAAATATRARSPASTSIPSRSYARPTARSGSAKSSDRSSSTSLPTAGCSRPPFRYPASGRRRTRTSISPTASRPERPTLAASRGFEGLAISPDGRTLYALLEGAVTGDDARDLRIYLYRMATRKFDDTFLRVRLEAPSQQVDLTQVVDERGERLYPEAVAPPPGPVSIGELKAVNAHQLLMIERDNLGDDERSPRFKKVFLLDLGEGGGAYVRKSLLLDLLALPDPAGVGGDGDFFRLPFYTIESVYPVDERTLVIASDNNFPFSNGRARSRNESRKGPLAADDSELVLVRVGTPLEVDSRLLPKLIGKGRP